MLPPLHRKCADCASTLPICAGQESRILCQPGAAKVRAARSLFWSNVIGWPCVLVHDGPFVEEDTSAAPRRQIDRSKPNLPLGVAIGSADCVPCRQKADQAITTAAISSGTAGPAGSITLSHAPDFDE